MHHRNWWNNNRWCWKLRFSHVNVQFNSKKFIVHSKDEATNFNAAIKDTNDFKSFMYKAKLLESTEADEANGILKNATTSQSLKYLSNSWRLFEMSLINCKAQLKLKWAKYFLFYLQLVLIMKKIGMTKFIFTIKDTKLYVPVATLSARSNPKLSELLSKGFEGSVYWNEFKTKTETKTATNKYRCFLESIFLGAIYYLY